MSDQQEDAVRRALAQAGAAPEPMPEHVAARLDGVLADLVAERAGGSDAGRENVVPLAPRRRWPSRLVAAAAVCVVVAGVGTVLAHNHPGTTSANESQAASGASGDVQRTPAAAGGAAVPQATPSTPDFAQQDQSAVAALPQLHRSTMAKDLRRVSARSMAMSTEKGAARTALACPALTRQQRQSWIPARLDHKVVAVVLGPVRSGKREVRVLSCEARSAPLAAYALPMP